MGLGAAGAAGALGAGETLVGAATGEAGFCSVGDSAAVGVGSGAVASSAFVGVGAVSFATGAAGVGSVACSSVFVGAFCCDGSRQRSRALSTQPVTSLPSIVT